MIKSQIIADFFADWGEHQYLPPASDSTYWRMNSDGSKMLGGLGAGVVLTSPEGDKLQYVLQMHFRASNNIAEYEAWCMGSSWPKRLASGGSSALETLTWWCTRSRGNGMPRTPIWPPIASTCSSSVDSSRAASFITSPEQKNDEADWLSKIGSTKQDILAGVSLEIIHKPSIKPSLESTAICVPEDPVLNQMTPPDSGAAASGLKEGAGQPSAAGSTENSRAAISRLAPTASQPDEAGTMMDLGAADPLVARVFHIREIPSWAEPFSNYLITGDLPQEEVEARRLQCHVQAYIIINSELYKRSVSGIFQKCIKPEEGMHLPEPWWLRPSVMVSIG
jgi:hypothetical protein